MNPTIIMRYLTTLCKLFIVFPDVYEIIDRVILKCYKLIKKLKICLAFNGSNRVSAEPDLF